MVRGRRRPGVNRPRSRPSAESAWGGLYGRLDDPSWTSHGRRRRGECRVRVMSGPSTDRIQLRFVRKNRVKTNTRERPRTLTNAAAKPGKSMRPSLNEEERAHAGRVQIPPSPPNFVARNPLKTLGLQAIGFSWLRDLRPICIRFPKTPLGMRRWLNVDAHADVLFASSADARLRALCRAARSGRLS